MIQPTPNTFVVGAGPVATALAGALRLAGVPVLGIWARDPAAARAASAVAGVASFSAAPPDLLLEARVIILAVKDDAISTVAETLLATGLVTGQHVMLHCSGAVSADEVLGNVGGRIGGIGIMHPLRAIPDGREAMRTLSGTVFGIEGDENGRAAAMALVRALGGRPLALSGEQMAAYHAAAAIASNYLVVLLDAATTLMKSVGIEGDEALAALLPLVEGTLANAREHGIEGALTGPIRRGDAATIGRHLEVMPAELAGLYRALGRRALAICVEAGYTDEGARRALDEYLAEE